LRNRDNQKQTARDLGESSFIRRKKRSFMKKRLGVRIGFIGADAQMDEARGKNLNSICALNCALTKGAVVLALLGVYSLPSEV